MGAHGPHERLPVNCSFGPRSMCVFRHVKNEQPRVSEPLQVRLALVKGQLYVPWLLFPGRRLS